MINISNERLYSLSNAAEHLPRRRSGQRPSPSTLYRWARTGLNGSLLETVQVGGTLCTSLEALQRFFERLTSVEKGLSENKTTGEAPHGS